MGGLVIVGGTFMSITMGGPIIVDGTFMSLSLLVAEDAPPCSATWLPPFNLCILSNGIARTASYSSPE